MFLPTDPTKKVRLYFNKFKTSNLIISNNSSPFTELFDKQKSYICSKGPL